MKYRRPLWIITLLLCMTTPLAGVQQAAAGDAGTHDVFPKLKTKAFWDQVVETLLSLSNDGPRVMPVMFGGTGGKPFSLSCPGPKGVVTGLKVRHGLWIDNIALVCEQLPELYKMTKQTKVTNYAGAGTGGTEETAMLPARFAMPGLQLRKCHVNTVPTDIICGLDVVGVAVNQYGLNNPLVVASQGTAPSPDLWTTSVKLSRFGAYPVFDTIVSYTNSSVYTSTYSACPKDMVMTGLKGRAGLFVDALQPVCMSVTSSMTVPSPKAVALDAVDIFAMPVAVGVASGWGCPMTCNGPIYAGVSGYGTFGGADGPVKLWGQAFACKEIVQPTSLSETNPSLACDIGEPTASYWAYSTTSYTPASSIAIGVEVAPVASGDSLHYFALVMAPLDKQALGKPYDRVVRRDLKYTTKPPQGLAEWAKENNNTTQVGTPKTVVCPDGFAMSAANLQRNADVLVYADEIRCSRILIDGKPGF